MKISFKVSSILGPSTQADVAEERRALLHLGRRLLDVLKSATHNVILAAPHGVLATSAASAEFAAASRNSLRFHSFIKRAAF
jgi:hypothetical protein